MTIASGVFDYNTIIRASIGCSLTKVITKKRKNKRLNILLIGSAIVGTANTYFTPSCLEGKQRPLKAREGKMVECGSCQINLGLSHIFSITVAVNYGGV